MLNRIGSSLVGMWPSDSVPVTAFYALYRSDQDTPSYERAPKAP